MMTMAMAVMPVMRHVAHASIQNSRDIRRMVMCVAMLRIVHNRPKDLPLSYTSDRNSLNDIDAESF
jgi:hypothetical protein